MRSFSYPEVSAEVPPLEAEAPFFPFCDACEEAGSDAEDGESVRTESGLEMPLYAC